MSFDEPPTEARMQRIELLVNQIEGLPDENARNMCREIIATLLELHATGLTRILSILRITKGPQQHVLDEFLQDDMIRGLLLLHDLHPESVERRVRQALDKVRPYLHSHGGDVELIEVSSVGVRLRMNGSCHGCPSSAATLRDTIERAICEMAPDVGTIEVEGLSRTSTQAELVQLTLSQEWNGANTSSPLPSQPEFVVNGCSSHALSIAPPEK